MTDPSCDGYLWDGSGEPDEQVRRLELLLARYRHAAVLPPSLAEDEGDGEPDAGSDCA